MYSLEQFKETALKRGYAWLGTIQLWMQQNPKEEYTEDDLIEVYRFQDQKEWRDKTPKKMRLTEDDRMQQKRDSWL